MGSAHASAGVITGAVAQADWSGFDSLVPALLALIGVVLTIAWTRAMEHARWKRQVYANFVGLATKAFYSGMFWARLTEYKLIPDEVLTNRFIDLDREMLSLIAEIAILDPPVFPVAEEVQGVVGLALEDIYQADYMRDPPDQWAWREKTFLAKRAAFTTRARRSVGLWGRHVEASPGSSAGKWLPY
jgi:hypothetical protein